MNEFMRNMRASLLRDLDQAIEQKSVPHEMATLVLLMEASRKLEHINRILAGRRAQSR